VLRKLIVLAMMGAVCTGCATGRIADLRDVAKLSLHAGLGFSVDARLGALSQPSIGLWSTSMGVGLESRDVGGIYFQKRVSFPYSVSYFRERKRGLLSSLNATGWHASFQVRGFQRAFEEIDRPLGTRPPREFGREIDGLLYGGQVREGAWLPIPDPSREDPVLTSFVEWTRFEFGAQGGIFGGRVGFNPIEFADFLLGFGGLDIAGDDVARSDAPEPEAGEEP